MKDIKELLNFGLINIDKCAGPTSYSVSEFVRRQLGLSKTSHMGTLDPKVTGVLPVTLGRACKLAGYFIRHDKTYVGILETHKECKIEELQKLIDANFVGKIMQTPPHRSAVLREERIREVFFWRLLEVGSWKSAPNGHDPAGPEVGSEGRGTSFLFEAKVEGGTYIRKLCSDLGDMIGGAHMGELRRTRAGVFSECVSVLVPECVSAGTSFDKIVDLFEFKSAVDKWKLDGDDSKLREMIVPAEEAIKKVLPCVGVDKCALKALYVGKPLLIENVVSKTELVPGDVFAVFCEQVFIGVYRKTDEEIIFGRSEFVFN
ncbi:MAG: hypothetical protein KJ592_05120 [Nanoarchaeota archaeon]|nr:hypothetical protein [Nanoarchaeota archaeon]